MYIHSALLIVFQKYYCIILEVRLRVAKKCHSLQCLFSCLQI